jgi:pilus assembly protein Flp/PilA
MPKYFCQALGFDLRFLLADAHRLIVSHGARLSCWEGRSMRLAVTLRRFLLSEDGPTAVEYAVMLALIVVVCLVAISAVGTNASTTFGNVANSISGS